MLRRTLGQLIGVLVLSLSVHGEPSRDSARIVDDVHFTQAKADQNGDPLPPGALARMGSLRWRHGENVTFVAFAGDGKSVITVSQDNVIRLWERESGKEIRRFETKAPAKPAGDPIRTGFNPYGNTAAARVTISRDGKTLAAMLPISNVVQLWDIATGKDIGQFKGPPTEAVAILLSPDGKLLAARSYDRTVHLIDAQSGKERCQIKGQAIQPGAVRVFLGGQGIGEAAGMAFSPDGKTLATSEMEFNMKINSYVRLNETDTGKEIRQIDTTPSGASAIAFSPDGKVLAFASGNVIHLREADGAKEIRKINADSIMSSLVFAPDGSSVAAKGRDQVVRLFETNTGNKIHEFGNPVVAGGPNANVAAFVVAGGASADGRDLAFSTDGKVLVVGSGQTVRFWNVATGKEQPHAGGGHRGAVSSVAFTPDGKTMFSRGADDVIRRWDANNGKELGQFTEPKNTTLVQFSPDGTTVACAIFDGTIHFFSTTDGKLLHTVKAHPVGSACIAFSPDSKLLASRGNTDSTIRLFDVAKGTEVKQITLPNANPNAGGIAVVVRGGFNMPGQPIVFSPDSQHLAVALTAPNFNVRGQAAQADGTLRIWDVNTGKEVRQITVPPGRPVSNLAYSPDGRVLAAENFDQTISLWEIASGRERGMIGEAMQPGQPVTPTAIRLLGAGVSGMRAGINPNVLAYSPDGALLAMRGPNNSVRVMEVSGGKQIGEFKGHEGAVLNAAFTSDGKRLATASSDTTTLVWDVASLKRTPRVQVGAMEPKELEKRWADLAGDDAVKAAKCIDELASASKQATPLFAERIKPATPVDVKKLEQWIIDLDSSNFQKRAKATSELEGLGDLAIPSLKKVIASQTTVETRRRAETMLEKLTTGTLTSDQVRMVRAIESLEKMATPEARQLLRTLADGAPGALQTRHAQAALDRVGGR